MQTKLDLPLVLRLNAVSSIATGLLMAVLSGPLARLTGIDARVLLVAGLGLLPFSAFALSVASRPDPLRVKLVSAIDFSWVAASVALVLLTDLTRLGVVLVLAIAAVVEVYGMLQLFFLRPVSATRASSR